MTHLKSFIKKESDTKEYNIDDIDNPNGWDWKEIDWLAGMGFDPGESESRMAYTYKPTGGEGESIKFTVYKNKDGYWLEINGRKHVFKTFINMQTIRNFF